MQEPIFLESLVVPDTRDEVLLQKLEASLRQNERIHILESFTRFFLSISQKEPVVLFLDDLNQADESTLFLLRYFLLRIFDNPIILLGAYRDDELRKDEPLFNLLLDLRRGLCTSIRLTGLSRQEVETLALQIIGKELPSSVLDSMYELTRGNPFFVEEMSRYVADELHGADLGPTTKIALPPSVKALLERRVTRLSPRAREVLTVAALVGLEFNPSVLSKASSAGEDEVLGALEEAAAAGLIIELERGGGVQFCFSDARVVGYLKESVLSTRRQKIHSQIAGALAETVANRVENFSDIIAYHYAQAGDHVNAAKYWEKAAVRAEQFRAYDEAIQSYRRIIENWKDSALASRAKQRILELEQALTAWTHSLSEIAGIAVRAGYDRLAEDYERNIVPIFRTFASKLVSLANLREGMAVLDLGTGTGNAAIEAAALVGRSGKALGVDVSEGMLHVGGEKAKRLGMSNVEFRVMDETALTLPDESQDVVLSNLGMPVLNPDIAMREAWRVLRNGGIFCFNEWESPEADSADKPGEIFQELLEKHRTAIPSARLATFRLAANYRGRGFERLWDQAVLRAMMEKANFKHVRVSTIRHPIIFESVDHYLAYAASWGGVALEMKEMRDPNGFMDEARQQLAQLATNGKLELAWGMNYYAGRK
jgi:ubiquinone/menaquinone biosynthesis C-methylase UbiE